MKMQKANKNRSHTHKDFLALIHRTQGKLMFCVLVASTPLIILLSFLHVTFRDILDWTLILLQINCIHILF